jgi:hypothetical protein
MAEAIGFEARSILCVPLKVHDHTIGVIEVINKLGKGGDTRFSERDLQMLTAIASSMAATLESARLLERTPAMTSAPLGRILASVARSASDPLRTFAKETYALKAGSRRGVISCSDDSLARMLDSMEVSIQQMASLTETLKKLSSAEGTAEDWAKLEQRLESLNERYTS